MLDLRVRSVCRLHTPCQCIGVMLELSCFTLIIFFVSCWKSVQDGWRYGKFIFQKEKKQPPQFTLICYVFTIYTRNCRMLEVVHQTAWMLELLSKIKISQPLLPNSLGIWFGILSLFRIQKLLSILLKIIKLYFHWKC